MNRRIYTVGQINHYIKGLFAGDGLLAAVFVSGEVSNCKYHTSGHIYFSLKDASGALSCIMFAGNRRGLAFRMKDGDKVVVGGTVDVYERGGSYQLYAKEIRLQGEGELYERFQQLRRELEKQGLFAAEHKKAIPKYAMTVGVVTAPTGAAVRDIQSISQRRNPYVQLILCPALVQGDGAADSIVSGIRALDGFVDLIIVGRGGGSLEDLWAFNEEKVARAIFECRTPVISAVGHETDTTISDLAADMRAPTPSAAAEIAVFDAREFREALALRERSLARGVYVRLQMLSSRAKWYQAKLSALSPQRRLNEERRRAADLSGALEAAFLGKLSRLRDRADRIALRLPDLAERSLRDRQRRFAVLAARFEGLNPVGRLQQGYSFVADAGRRAVRSVTQVQAGDAVTIHVTDGRIVAEVKETLAD